MKSFTRWLFFVAIASMIALFPLQAQEHGEKGDKGKNGQGVKGEHHDGDSKGDKDEKKEFDVNLRVIDFSTGRTLDRSKQKVTATVGTCVFVVTLPFSTSASGAWNLANVAYTGNATSVTADVAGNLATVTVNGVGSVSGMKGDDVDILVYVVPGDVPVLE